MNKDSDGLAAGSLMPGSVRPVIARGHGSALEVDSSSGWPGHDPHQEAFQVRAARVAWPDRLGWNQSRRETWARVKS
jgi:hypothetical protein